MEKSYVLLMNRLHFKNRAQNLRLFWEFKIDIVLVCHYRIIENPGMEQMPSPIIKVITEMNKKPGTIAKVNV